MQDLPFFQQFRDQLRGPDTISKLQSGLIGEGQVIDGPYGPRPLIYADYIASGRSLRQIEDALMQHVLPFYANSHTEASYCGAFMTGLRQQARAVIAAHCKAGDRFSTIFTGSGATAGLNKLVALLDLPGAVASGQSPLALIGPYEHHSNILPWRETGAEVIEIPEDQTMGGPDLVALETVLRQAVGRPVIGAFSAASNVSGIVTDTVQITRLLKRYGALAIWDYAGGAPYLDMDMHAGTDHEKDAIVFSPHKFIGGPGASGVLILRKGMVKRKTPVWPGGGTVSYVSSWGQDYLESLHAREEAGTPNILGDIRAALAIIVKESIGQDWLNTRHQALRTRGVAALRAIPNLRYAGDDRLASALPFFSFWLPRRAGQMPWCQHAITQALSDHFGVQARGGCACAGPYGHQLFGIPRTTSETIRAAIQAGNDSAKPGFTRFNLSALMCDTKIDSLLEAITRLATNPSAYLGGSDHLADADHTNASRRALIASK